MKSLATRLFALAFAVAGFTAAQAQAQAQNQTAAQEVRKMEYRLGAGDTIRVNVFQNPDLTLETRVSENGTVTYPLIGEVKLGGLGIGEAERTIAGKLRDGGYVRQPQVNILVTQVRGNQVSVLGLVGKPGRYPIETFNTRVSDMLASAGGIAPTGADSLIITGVREGKSFKKEIDIPSLFMGDNSPQDLEVAAGDVIYVHRAPMYYIYGEVQKAGSYRLERDMTVLQALAQGGGLTARGTERGMRLHRRSGDGKVSVLDPKMDQTLQPDDVIYVRESLF